MEVQVIDDLKGNTLVFGDTKSAKAKNNIEGARILGKLIAKNTEKKIKGSGI